MTLAFALTLVAIGFAGAFVSGLVGVGGAIVMIPLLLYVPPLLGVGSLDVRHIAGVTMTQVLASALVGAWQHGRSAVVVPVARIGGASMAAGSLLGALGSGLVGSRVLLAVFAVMSTAALLLMLLPPFAPLLTGARDEPLRFSRRKAAIYPFLIGAGSGMIGAGGAFLLVPP